jgi:hypothetical protein
MKVASLVRVHMALSLPILASLGNWLRWTWEVLDDIFYYAPASEPLVASSGLRRNDFSPMQGRIVWEMFFDTGQKLAFSNASECLASRDSVT